MTNSQTIEYLEDQVWTLERKLEAKEEALELAIEQQQDDLKAFKQFVCWWQLQAAKRFAVLEGSEPASIGDYTGTPSVDVMAMAEKLVSMDITL